MSHPNFIIFLTDDHGHGDLGCFGAKDLHTPNIDRIASDGVRFTNWYSNAPVCSPSRAALLTGRYPAHAGVRGNVPSHRADVGLAPSVPTLATALKAYGYRTAHFGKWHLGTSKGYRPEDHGFDETFGFVNGCIDYFSHIFYWGYRDGDPLHDLWHNGQEVYRNGEYVIELITQAAVQNLRTARNDRRPFFMYIPFNAPHYPMHAPKKYLDRFAHLPWERQIMAAAISAADDGVGAVLDELQAQGLDDDTLVFFGSDHGPSRETRNWLDGRKDPYYGGSTGGLKGHKFSLFDGGIKLPAVMRCPARIKPNRVIDPVCASFDLFPTILKLAGGDPSHHEIDGQDIFPVITQGQETGERTLFWEEGKQTAVRRGKWKLVLNGRLVEGVPPEDAVHLADLEADPGEKVNLKNAHPDIVKELSDLAMNWRQKLGE
jgi:arylsulfatase A-like enzyme